MPNLNKVLFAGHLGRDAETKSMPNGDTVTNFSVAATEKFTTKAGEKKEVTEWLNVVSWRLSEKFTPLLTKGSAVFVEGKLRTRNYEKDGVTKYITEVVADSVQLLGGRGEARGAVADDDSGLPF